MVGGVTHAGETKNTGMGALETQEGPARLLEKRFHLIEEAIAIGFHGHAALFGVLHQQFFLSRRQFGGNLDLHRIGLIAGRPSLQTGNPQSFDAEDFVMLSARRNFDDGVPLESRYFHFPAEYRRD